MPIIPEREDENPLKDKVIKDVAIKDNAIKDNPFAFKDNVAGDKSSKRGSVGTQATKAYREEDVRAAALWLKRRLQAYSRYDGFHKHQVIVVSEALQLLKEAFVDIFPQSEPVEGAQSSGQSYQEENPK
ncbi:hypothetical protein HYU13_01135 [Candidatus Woesearchaeota archaeon]|nr:hypothetical protein [Candidatus Woesearchaeota archaeon]